MVLYARKVAVRRAERGGLGSGRLHVRLVALFTAVAAVPTVLVAIFASVLFQSGLEFWFSDRARSMLENTVEVARASYDREAERVSNETVTMSGDFAGYLQQIAIDDPRFADLFPRQVLIRNLSEAIIFTYGADHADPHACSGQSLRPATRQSNYARQDRAAEDASQRDDQFHRPYRSGDADQLLAPTLTSTLHACSIPS